MTTKTPEKKDRDLAVALYAIMAFPPYPDAELLDNWERGIDWLCRMLRVPPWTVGLVGPTKLRDRPGRLRRWRWWQTTWAREGRARYRRWRAA